MWPYYTWRQRSVFAPASLNKYLGSRRLLPCLSSFHDVKSLRRFDRLRQVVPRKLHDLLKYLILSIRYTLLSIFVPLEELNDTRPLRIAVTINGGHLERRHLVCPFCNHSLEASLQARHYHWCQAKTHSDHAAFHAAIAAAESKPIPTYEIRRSQLQFVFF
jgi:hypothetical protein